MTRTSGRRLGGLALFPILAFSGVAHAQATPGASGDWLVRPGPNGAAAAPPAYATPHPFPSGPAPQDGTTSRTGPRTAINLSEIVVDSSGAMGKAVARRRWRPRADPASDVSLDVRPHEALDAHWVRRQFQLNRLVGAPTTADRVVALVLLINQAYAQNGYVNSGLLFAQHDWAGRGAVLHLALIRGRISPVEAKGPTVTVAWAKGHAKGLRRKFVRDRMPSAKRAPLNVIEVEHDFRLLADDPAVRTVNAQLVPGAQPGAASLSMTVAPQPRLDLYVSAANNRSPTVGGERVSVGGSLRNAVFSGDLLSADGGVTRGLLDGTVSYSTPFLSPRTLVSFRVSSDQAAVVEPALRGLDIRSAETDFEGGISQVILQDPLTPKPDGSGWLAARSLVVGLSAAEKYSTSTLLGTPFSFSPGAVDGRSDFTVVRASVDYVERGERQVIAVSVTDTLGVRGTGSDIPGVNRPDPNFDVVLGQFNYARRLSSGGLEFRARLAGQWSDSLLYSAEQFAVGGQSTVRGYRENLILADSGALGSLELSCPLTLGRSFCVARGDDWKTIRLSVFVDGAYTRDHYNPQPTPQDLASVGASVTWAPSPALFIRLTYAKALINPDISGPRDLQDEGFEFEVTFHPLSLWRGRG